MTGAASKNLPELVQYDGIPGAKYRPTDIHGHYRFTIGKAVVEQDDDHLLLAVPVGPHSLTRGIEVFDHGSLEGMSLNETQHFSPKRVWLKRGSFTCTRSRLY